MSESLILPGRDANGAPVLVTIGVNNGAVRVSQAASNAVSISAGTYDATTILDFKLTALGSGDLVFTPSAAGSAPITVTNAQLAGMGAAAFLAFNISASSITLGAGMTAILNIP